MSEQPKSPSEGTGKGAKKNADEPITIKKYANRRLYNTATSTYVTLDYLSEMVKNGQDFVVFDAKSGDDITRGVLTQIIFEEENKGQNLLPIQFLRQLIKFYGDNLQSFVPSYLEMSMNAFSENQEKMRAHMRDAFGGAPGYAMFEETTRKNMQLFEQAMKMFNPMSNAMGNLYASSQPQPTAGARESGEIDELRSQVQALQAKLAKLEDE
ncbi:MAG: polyhydroxyalkanoate synthesis repressor PhaR [Pseudomonadota bacterium]